MSEGGVKGSENVEGRGVWLPFVVVLFRLMREVGEAASESVEKLR